MQRAPRGTTTGDPILTPGTAFADAVDSVRRGARGVEEAAASLRSLLTEQELLWLLDGDLPVVRGLWGFAIGYGATTYQGGQLDRLGIPGIRFTDGPRGVVTGVATAFPAALARAATFDPELERRIGDAMGAEARARGANLFAGICVNLAYAPGWGRSQESYGEEPVLLGAMGSAVTEGVNPWVMSCLKHFAVNSMEVSRFQVDVRVDEDLLHEIYLPHFRQVVEAGADSVMTAYNSVNGTWAGDNGHLMTDILRERWGFEGFTMTDFVWGLRDPVGSVRAGQDLEMPLRQQRAATLPQALHDGRLALADVHAAADRLLAAQIRLALRARPTPDLDVIASPAHRELAREAARRSVVLLRNTTVGQAPALPLDADAIGTIAVLGSLLDSPNLGDVGSSVVTPPSTVSVLQGLRERLGDRVVHVAERDLPGIAHADAVVVVVGLSSADEGESLLGVTTPATQLLGGLARIRPIAAALGRVMGVLSKWKGWGGDRDDLRLHASDVALIRAAARLNRRVIVVVIGGGTIVLDPWDQEVAAVLLAWYPGMEGGRALADVLFGDAEPAGRLPLAIPHRKGDLPVLDWRASSVRYGRWWGQRKLDRDGVPAAYPFGFGLGYSPFSLDSLTLGPVEDERFSAVVRVTNRGVRAGRHVVQVYAAREEGGRTVRPLLGFRSVAIGAGETVEVEVGASTRPLQRWTADGFVTDPGEITVEAASYSGDPGALAAPLTLR
ncbi:glycoside hydrolase family 3 C-terminal domain-containing protein [Amnibacterium flavum]|uniref:Beta-glucosidase n=1 Tax=Amnibacterium flavum TaxID=2173173 RepID=A0A2V1HS56_9MICO|nr:glycoside hydrolase family 3 C-terminal domain-containing protein [Amnibacterium flavum]PVZ95171.1 beta-glucosidase [Amnibacterium flavum]